MSRARESTRPAPHVLDLLESVQSSGDGWTALCLAHHDRKNSLSIGEGDDGRVLLHCHAGCDTEEILTAVDLEKADLFPRARTKHREKARDSVGLTLNEYAEAKRLPVEFLQKLGVGNVHLSGTPAVRIPYMNPQGQVAAARFRHSMHGDIRFTWKTGDKPSLYGLWRLHKARKRGYICLVEGESDAHTLWLHHVPAIGLPGAAAWKEEWTKHFKDIKRIYIVLEPDRGGEAVRAWLRKSKIRDQARLVTLEGVKDPSELYLLRPKKFRRAWKTAMKQAVHWAESAEESASPELEHLTDLGNARRFVVHHGKEIRYCHTWKRWLVWDGRRWKVDESGAVERRAKKTVRRLYKEASAEENDGLRKKLGTWARQSESRSRITAMIELAKSEPEIPVQPAELDSDPWLLNFENGSLDLRTGELRDHRTDDLCTKIVPVAYDPKAVCPKFKKFLRRILNHNTNLIRFVQRAMGYSLTGSTQEQAIFILWGCGANGKSTLLETIRAGLGDYARTADPTLLMSHKYDGVRNDVARLAGARFVSTAETEAGRQLAEVLVKQLTGGDKLTARFLYSEFFEFDAQFKLFLATNHKPVIRGTDNAIWRRVRLVPFDVTIPEDEQDRTLSQKLHAELPGILAWTVRGCLRWQKHGLGKPKEVSVATQSYREEMDTFGGFLKDCFEEMKDGKVSTGDLYKKYTMWCQDNGERPLTKQKVGVLLVERGFKPYRSAHVRMWRGLKLRDEDDGDDVDFE